LAQLLVLLMYPAVILLVVQPRAFRIVRSHGGQLFRPRVSREVLADELEQSGRWLLIAKFGLAGALLLLWIKIYRFPLITLGVSEKVILIGLKAGFLSAGLLTCGKLLFQILIRRVPFVHLDSAKHSQSRGSILLWIATFVLAGLFEEPWRAVSLTTCIDAGWGQILAVSATAAAFVFAQTSGIPSRVSTANYEGTWEFIVGLFLAILFLKFGTIVVPFVASLIYNIVNLLFIRKDFDGTRRSD